LIVAEHQLSRLEVGQQWRVPGQDAEVTSSAPGDDEFAFPLEQRLQGC
jgi:hypothetical protein